MLKGLYTFIFIITFYSSYAQKVKFRVVDQNNKPVFGASIRLISKADSTKIWGTLTDTVGVANFDIPVGLYTVKASIVGYKSIDKVLNLKPDIRNVNLTLTEEAKNLDAVVVTARKPLMRQEDDKTIVDPEPIVNTSTNAYEIIEKLPGVFLDQEGNVYLSSTSPATIYINGREQRMGAAEVATILKSLPPNSIEKIEILRSPSTKYEASNVGGIVNIVLKKGVKIGFTGSVFANANQGRFGNQNLGFNLNNSVGNSTMYFNFNHSRRKTFESLETTRLAPAFIEQKSYTIIPSLGYFSGYGFSFEPSKKWDISTDGQFSWGETNTKSQNNNRLKNSQPSLANTEVATTNTNNSLTKNINFTQSINTKLKIDSLGSEWVTDLSYRYIGNYLNQNFDILRNADLISGGFGLVDGVRHSGIAQSDLKFKTTSKWTFEIGGRASWLRFDNKANFTNDNNGIPSNDLQRSNEFNYSEQIQALYAQAAHSVGKVNVKAGVRLENTNMVGNQIIPGISNFEVKRTDLFPYLFLSRNITKIAGFDLMGNLIYRRSITRPVYDNLNPFNKFIDQYLSEIGNPNLKPQFTENVEANIMVSDFPLLAIGQNYTTDIFTNVVYQDKQDPTINIRTFDNLGKNRETYVRMVGGMPPVGKYFFYLGVQYNANHYVGEYEGRPLDFDRGFYSLFSYQQLKFGKNNSLGFFAFARFKSQQQFYELSTFGRANIFFNKNFLNKKLNLGLSLNDILYTDRNNFTFNQGSISASGKRWADTRRFGINLRYNFGLRKKEESQGGVNFDALENAGK